MNNGRYLGIDYGKKNVGFAISDEAGVFAFPYAIYPNNALLLASALEMISKEQVKTIVIGKSQTYSGEDNPIMERVREFADALRLQSGAVVVFEDETLSSAQARRAYETNEASRTPNSREVVDASAAAIILQSYLDKRRKER